MNIAFVNSTRKWGGVKTWSVDFGRRLSERGHNMYVYGRQREFVDKCAAAGMTAQQVSFGFDFHPGRICFFYREFKRLKIDLVVVNIGKDLRTAAVGAALAKIPVIQRVGLPNDMDEAWMTTIVHKMCDIEFLGPCKYVTDGILRNLPYVQPEKTKVIFNAKVPAPAITSANTPRRFVSASQINPDKGHADVLDALSVLHSEGVDFEYNILGQGHLQKKLQKAYAPLETAGKLNWQGFTTDVNGFLRGCDIFLLPSYKEGMPNALLEAMAQGLVPISRDVGGVKELWPDSLKELLLPASAGAKEFQEIIAQVLSLDDTQLQEYKQAALDACRETFSSEKKAVELEEYFRSIAGKAAKK
ncbi:MAG: glycosyltransferase [Desulfovibrio sp.]